MHSPAGTYILPFWKSCTLLGSRTNMSRTSFLHWLRSSASPLGPPLRRLLLTSQAAGDAIIEPLLRKFGHSLHFASLVRPCIKNVHPRFYNPPSPPPPPPLVTPSLSMCPNLRRLATDTHFPIRMPMHAHLTWVDLWVPIKNLDPSEQSAVTFVPHEERIDFSSLRGVRLLDLSLFPFSGVRTPLLIPPDMVGSTESVAWTYPG
ncbi:hypothetical protein C8R48DRAFT_188401 [Suillus tomentosus]|nr:hypothetical protein C8R48DRAFT_188401 [Suillus tomentosus]